MNPLTIDEGSQAYYLEKSIQLCQEKGIQVLVVTSPLCPTYMQNVENYRVIHDAIQTIANKYGVEYLDYNLIDSQELRIKDENFRDRSHLNYSGVEILDVHLIQYLKEKNYLS